MKLLNKQITLKQFFCLLLYYSFLYYLPQSGCPLLGKISQKMRYWCCRNIFKRCGCNVNIERKAYFGMGTLLEIGDNSGIGVNATIPPDTIIGDNVMMGPNCYILAINHSFDRIDIPMLNQGFSGNRRTIIGNDVWIGRDVLMTPGRKIADGSIIGAGCVLTKDFPKYSIIGGNPSRIIRSRI